MRRDERGDAAAVYWIAIILGVIALALALAIKADQAYSERCAALGGSAHSSTSTGVGINPSNGQAVPVATTSAMCLSPDGRVLTP